MRNLSIKLGFLAALLSIGTAQARLNSGDLAQFDEENLLSNPGFEYGVAKWTATGATLSQVTSGVIKGAKSATFDPDSQNDEFKTEEITLPRGLYGQECQFSISYYGGDSSVAMKAQVFNGDDELLNEKVILAHGDTAIEEVVPFICASKTAVDADADKGVVYGKIIQSGVGDAAGATYDSAHLGGRKGKVEVSDSRVESVIVGAATSAAFNNTTNIIWPTETIDYLNQYNNSTGVFTAAENRRFCWSAKIQINGTSASNAFASLSPYKNGSIQSSFNDVVRWEAVGVDGKTLNSVGCLDLSQGDTMYWRANTNLGSPVMTSGTEGDALSIWSFPLQSTSAQKIGFPGQEWTAFSVVSSHTINVTHTGLYQCNAGNLWLQYRSTYSGANTQGVLTYDLPIGFTADSNKVITGTSGTYRMLYSGGTALTNNGGTRTWDLAAALDTSTTRVKVAYRNETGSGTVFTSIESSINTPAIFASSDSYAINLIVPLTTNSPCPRTGGEGLFKQSLTTSSNGLQRVERATVNLAGTPAVSFQSGSWISLNTDNGIGDVTWNISGFSSEPTCTCSARIGAADTNAYTCNVLVPGSSSTLRTVGSQINSGGTGVTRHDIFADIVCMGNP